MSDAGHQISEHVLEDELVAFGLPEHELAERACEATDAAIKQEALQELRSSGSALAIETMIALLTDADRDVRIVAAESLQDWRAQRALAALEQAAAEEVDPEVRRVFARTVAMLQAPGPTVEALRRHGEPR